MNKLSALVLLMSAALIAGDVTGTWKGQVNRPDGTKEEDVILHLTQEGKSVAGKVGTAEEMIPIRNAEFDGRKLTFEVAAHEATFAITLDFDGETAKGGVIRTRDGKSGPFCPMELKRSASDAH
jgi:hypothetical protein